MITYLANPNRFLRFAKLAIPAFLILFIVTLIYGLSQALVISPADMKHGEAVRIMYVHVPAAYLSMMAYIALFIASVVSFVWRHNLADYGARAFARIGAMFTALCLATGSIWGKTGWGTWWEWDGRMTSVLVLFFIYLAYLLIWGMIENKKQAARFAAIFAMVGLINIPIIKFSVDWWNSLHQTATISKIGGSGLSPEMLKPFLAMCLAYTFLFAWLSIVQVRGDISRAKSNRLNTETLSKTKIEEI